MSAATDSLIRACQKSHEVKPGGPLDQLLRLLSAGGGAALGDSGFRRQRFTAVRSVQINGADA